jgi:uracil-DNA glycosylase
MATLDALLAEIAACRACAPFLPHGPRPVVRIHPDARILIAGQAPGRKVHETGLPWNDASGDRLRQWMGLDRDQFYDPRNIAVAAMGFCWPGTVNGADLPPRRECAPLWRNRLLAHLTGVRLTLVVGAHAQAWHLGADARRAGMTRLVERFAREGSARTAAVIPLPHPSWRNTAWLRRHPWFETDLLPLLRSRVQEALS